MKTFIVKIKIQGLAGDRTSDREVKARNEKSARNKAYDLIGDQSGEILSIWNKAEIGNKI